MVQWPAQFTLNCEEKGLILNSIEIVRVNVLKRPKSTKGRNRVALKVVFDDGTFGCLCFWHDLAKWLLSKSGI